MIYVPECFQPHHPFPYPPDNIVEFERWYLDNYDYQPEGWEYLPVMWTAYYCKHNFGQKVSAMARLQTFLNRLDRSNKYYTIVQYDGGLLHDVSHLDIKVFSMSGGRTDYPLPLISQPHGFNHNVTKYHLANFIGKMTHPIRQKLQQCSYFNDARQNWYFSDQPHTLQQYCHKIAQSVFTLCPRGFGPTSFRIQESLQYGSIPVYISDEFVIPHNVPFDRYGVLIQPENIHRIHDILTSIPEAEIRRRRQEIPDIYQRYFTYEGCADMIRLNLKNPAEVGIA